MIIKTQFMDFIARVERTEKGIHKLEEAFDGISIYENDICALQGYAARIAFTFFGFENEDYFESFLTDFWAILDQGKSEFSILKNEEETKYCLSCWEEFYDFWKKTREECV